MLRASNYPRAMAKSEKMDASSVSVHFQLWNLRKAMISWRVLSQYSYNMMRDPLWDLNILISFYIFVFILKDVAVFELYNEAGTFRILLECLENVDLIEGRLEGIIFVIVEVDNVHTILFTWFLFYQSKNAQIECVRVHNDVLLNLGAITYLIYLPVLFILVTKVMLLNLEFYGYRLRGLQLTVWFYEKNELLCSIWVESVTI